ncbi:MAG: hypothetical protein AB7U86_12090, partial [Methylocystis sp.]
MPRQPYVLAFLAALAASPALAWDGEYDGPGRDAPFYRSESFGHGYDPYDDGAEAWFAPNGGSWADHADAYYGYGECRFLREPVFGQR